MTKIKCIEYFRVPPRWLFVKICDEDRNYGWGESTLEGHTEGVEGTLNAMIKRFVGYEAEQVPFDFSQMQVCRGLARLTMLLLLV